MKVLILSCKTGGGHDAAGRAILEQLQQMGEEAYLFDAIVMPHLFPAETITYMKRKGMDLPLTVAVATDYTCIQPHSRRTFAAFVAASIYTALMIPQKSVVVALCLMSFVVLHKHTMCEREHADA